MIRKMTFALTAAAMSLGAAGCTTMNTMGNPTVGGAEMMSSMNIVENASNSPIHTTLVQAVVAADLADTLSGDGPFTVFAPDNQAFAAVPAATRNALMAPANKAMLQSVLTYHVVPGRVTAADLMDMIAAGNGRAMVTTVNGQQLTATMEGQYVKLMGKGGSTAYVSQADVMQSNGIIHVVNGVLTPSM